MLALRACPHCSVMKTFVNFQIGEIGKPVGWCRKCRAEKEAERRRSNGITKKEFSQIVDGEKLCMNCKLFKAFSRFSPAERGIGGLAAYCKPCTADKYRNKEKARLATARYRAKNRAKHLANHRVQMFERNHFKKVGTDGTVTTEFINSLYATTHCHYCFLFTPPEKRTADHLTALAKGGLHSTSNLVMACHSCNSSKRDLSEHEFRSRMMKNFDLDSYLKCHLPPSKDKHASQYNPWPSRRSWNR
jgi:5-methylcytosine-specific restriction endonuclease McrA